MDSSLVQVLLPVGLAIGLGLVLYKPAKEWLAYRRWAKAHPKEAAAQEAEVAKEKADAKKVKAEIRASSRGGRGW